MKKVLFSILALVLALSLALPMAAVVGAQPTYIETIYLVDTLSLTADDGSTIYTVDLVDGTSNKANLTWFCDMPPGQNARYDTVAALACSPDGGTLYVIDRDTSWLAKYDIATTTWAEVGATGIGNCVQLVCSADGTLYASSNNSDSIWTVNTSTATATLVGLIKEGTTTVNVQGADIVFAADETLYLWTDGGKQGLYSLSLPVTPPADVTASFIGNSTPDYGFTGLAIRSGGAGDLIGSTTDDYIRQLNTSNASLIESYAMYLADEPYDYAWGDMTIGELAVEECLPVEVILCAGQHTDVGTATVSDDGINLTVVYETTGDWIITETHLYVGTTNPATTPPLTSAPGQYPYDDDYPSSGVPDTTVTYVIPLADIDGYHMKLNNKDKPTGVLEADDDSGAGPCEPVYIAAHAVVIRLDETCIDFENDSEFDEISTVSTPNGNVGFYMTDYTPLATLAVGGSATLPPSGDYPVVAEPGTNTAPFGTYPNIVAFTTGGPPYTGADDIVLDDHGTGAGGNTLTDPQDTLQTELMWHAYSQFLAIVIDITDLDWVEDLGLVTIDLDHGELWNFLYFDADGVLIHKDTISAGGGSYDGEAFPISWIDDEYSIAKVVVFGEMNNNNQGVVGYAIDNICITSAVQEETAWAGGECDEYAIPYPGANWTTYFEYQICCVD
ncbi:hypothetical protein ACFLTV_01845 [Chloroflexota bacterium]